ncbi:DEAD/DEAH box helicase [Fodinicola feengrottensis]|uniref:DEAD/DEAH box helicase n=1 Tax=Fodinicola feengrottensis TaxID=435914 RepID=UPI0028BDE68E|nr:DEAD/DEAH box helicase [Fodinicola feengrottensis]
MTISAELRERAQAQLGTLAGPQALLRDDQAAAISALVADHRRCVVVQRTGWGKSAVYWIATALRRAQGYGPTLVVSPLLALMRDQVGAAQRAGIHAVTLNSSNFDEWSSIEAEIAADRADVLLISPERLNSAGFRSRVLPNLAPRLGMLVVDEAHCISDWGHDFRPDYRRIRQVLAGLPAATPVLATTATANSRVIDDISSQLGDDTLTLRGPLDRKSLALSVVDMPNVPAAYAWIADALHELPGSGIVYTLTVAETERLAAFLGTQGHRAEAYSGRTDPEVRGSLEKALLANDLKALVATSSLGMGLDKPDLAFVIHLGARPVHLSLITSRSAAPAAPWTRRGRCCCRPRRTPTSGRISTPPPSRPSARSAASWTCWRARTARSPSPSWKARPSWPAAGWSHC